ncbi:MAG: HAD family hydrolase [Deltaproteobacteria bacterium]|nr:HAD family hydrolase [Deltaproteobacteria bacterium]
MNVAIFDMDGTLLRLGVDIEEVRASLAALFAPYGVTRPFRPILKRIQEAAEEAARAGGDAGALRRQGLAILDSFEVAAAQGARPRAGAAEVLGTLSKRGVRLGLVTDNGRACVAPALRAAGIPAEALGATSTRDDVRLPKPDPEGVIAVARALGPAATTWWIGDHPKDVEAGLRTAQVVPGLRVAAVKGGLADTAGLLRAGAEVVLDDLQGVLGLPGLSPPWSSSS